MQRTFPAALAVSSGTAALSHATRASLASVSVACARTPRTATIGADAIRSASFSATSSVYSPSTSSVPSYASSAPTMRHSQYSPLYTPRRYGSVRSLFGIPTRRAGPRTQEERERIHREQDAFDARRYHTLGEYLDRMPSVLRMLLVWSPVSCLLYFCGKQQRRYYLEDDERIFSLLLPKVLKRRLMDGPAATATIATALHAKQDVAISSDRVESLDDVIAAEGMRTLLAVPAPGRECHSFVLRAALCSTRMHAAPPPLPSERNAFSRQPVGRVTRRQPDGSLITQLKHAAYMPADDVMDPHRAHALRALRQQLLEERQAQDAARSYFSPRRWSESLKGLVRRLAFKVTSTITSTTTTTAHDFDATAGERRQTSDPTGVCVCTPIIRPFSTERVTVTAAPRADEGFLASVGLSTPTRLLERLTGCKGAARRRDEATMMETLEAVSARAARQRNYDNVWNRPLVVLRDEHTGKVVGYST